MSCDWHIHCKTCDSTHEFYDANHEVKLMRLLIEHASAIAALAPLANDPKAYNEIELKADRWTIDIGWFEQHARHELVPRNEYGGFDNG